MYVHTYRLDQSVPCLCLCLDLRLNLNELCQRKHVAEFVRVCVFTRSAELMVPRAKRISSGRFPHSISLWKNNNKLAYTGALENLQEPIRGPGKVVSYRENLYGSIFTVVSMGGGAH